MAAFTGVTGTIEIPHESLGLNEGADTEPSDVLHVFRWTATIVRDVHEVSEFQQNEVTPTNEKTKIGGAYHLIGTAEGWFDSAKCFVLDPEWPDGTYKNGIQKEDCAAKANFDLILRQSAGTPMRLRFDGIIGTLSTDAPKNAPVRFSLSFESSAAVTPAEYVAP